MTKLFQVNSEFTSEDLCMSTGTRVYLKKAGCAQLLNSRNTILARERRRLAIGAYNAEKAISGVEAAKIVQRGYLQRFEYRKRGLIIYTKHNDKFVPIYAINKGPVAVSSAWFTTNQETVQRMKSKKAVKNAQADFKTFVDGYTSSSIMTAKKYEHNTWFNTMVMETQEVLTKQLAKVAS
jgi:hypothetical protein